MRKGGRKRGVEKTTEEKFLEEQAKGHTHAQQLSYRDEWVLDPSRGIQHGYGKNQADEMTTQKTKFQNKSIGGHHG